MSSDDWKPDRSTDGAHAEPESPELRTGPSRTSQEDESARAGSTKQRIRLIKGGGIILEPDGFRIIEARGIKRSQLLPYESLTHIAATQRALLVATTSGLSILRTSDFPDPETGPAEAKRALMDRLAERPDGDFCMERIASLEALSQQKSRNWAVWGVVALCLVGTLWQLRDSTVAQFGSFVAELFSRGEFWRGVTAHFLHGAPTLPIHLAVNVGGLIALGHLVERPLGSAKTTIVFAFGGIGTILGSLMGYFGGKVDMLGMRLVEIMMCFPVFAFLLICVSVFETRSIFLVMVIIGLVGWTSVARLVRGQFIAERSLEYVTAARALAIPTRRIVFKHVLPNAIFPVFVSATFGVAAAILTESGLAFLGLGDPTVPSWGQILLQGRETGEWWLIHSPGFAIFFTVTILNILGEGLRDALDPKLRT